MKAILVLVMVSWTVACKGSGPTNPSETRPPTTGAPASSTNTPTSNGETFAVSGIVTDEQGAAIAGAKVTMRYWLAGRVNSSLTVTDGSGHYALDFTSNPWTNSSGRGAARAEVMADGYDWFWRNVIATGPQLVENIGLRRLVRTTAGDSVVISVTPANGDCLGWLYGPCGREYVTPK